MPPADPTSAPRHAGARRHPRRSLAAAALVGIGLALAAANALFPPPLNKLANLSSAILASDGTCLDIQTSPDGYWRLPPGAVSPNYVALLIKTEDKSFWTNPGIAPLALARATLQFATHGHIVSGGSTITMQVARLLTPHPRTLPGKFFEIFRALQLTARYSKPQILQMYLTLAPYGGNLEGVRAASYAYFQSPPDKLTDAQAALLVALPRAPEQLRPDRHPAAALSVTRKVLARAGLSPDVPPTDLPPLTRHPFPTLAPYLAEHAHGVIATTLDADLQSKLAALATRALPTLPPNENIAALIVRNSDRAILAYLGGANFRAGRGGMVDMVRASRSPGSALKPFIYGIAMDDDLILPDTLIDDSPLTDSAYAPQNFDRQFHGMVTAAAALQNSYNLAAIKLVRAIGPVRFIAALRTAGARITLPGGTAATLPVALGGEGISLADMAMLYTALADGGTAAPLRLRPTDPQSEGTALLTPASAASIGAILRGAPPPDGIGAASRSIAYKTGTSYGFRDAWSAGFSGDYTVVVWTGQTDGTPTPGAYGRAIAAPLLFRIFTLLPPDLHTPPPAPPEPDLATLSPALQIFGTPRLTAHRQAARRLTILFPPNGALLAVTGGAPISLEAQGGTPPYRWMINGQPLPPTQVGLSTSWSPPGPGFAHISVLDHNLQAASANIAMQ